MFNTVTLWQGQARYVPRCIRTTVILRDEKASVQFPRPDRKYSKVFIIMDKLFSLFSKPGGDSQSSMSKDDAEPPVLARPDPVVSNGLWIFLYTLRATENLLAMAKRK